MSDIQPKVPKMNWTERLALLLLARRLHTQPDLGEASLSETLMELPELRAFTEEHRNAIRRRWTNEELSRCFHLRGVINPHVFTDVLNRSLTYYVVDAKGQYLAIEAYALTQPHILNVHRLFGKDDLLLLAVGQRADRQFAEFVSTMARLRAELLIFEIDQVIRYKTYAVPELANSQNSIDETWARTLDAYASDYNEAKISLRPPKQLKDRGYLLGTYWTEDARITGRVQAFVAVQFLDVVRKEVVQRYGDLLAEIETVQPHLVSVYHLKSGQPYDFLIELVCDTYTELDIATDDIIAQAPLPVETLTLPIAGTSRDGVPTIGSGATSFGRGLSAIWAALTPAEREKLQAMAQDDLTLIALRDTLDRIVPDRLDGGPRASDVEEQQIYDVAKQFTKAVLDEAVNNMLSIRGQLFVNLERRIRSTAEKLIDQHYGGDTRAAQLNVGAPVKLPLDWASAQAFLTKWMEQATDVEGDTRAVWDELNELATGLRAIRNKEFHGLAKTSALRKQALGFAVLSAGKDLAETAYSIRLTEVLARGLAGRETHHG